MKEENRQYCLGIARELEAIADGDVYKCPCCFENFRFSDAEETFDEDGEPVYACTHCGEKTREDMLEQITVYDYFADSYDMEFIVSADKEYKGVRIWVAVGGPSVWIDTSDSTVKLAWWGERAECDLYSDACALVDQYGEEMYA
ncbi:MAG: hypothetical protein NC548_40460 [Lachnospiraceae bacterium]|nr:hypothetical protein [Lachnospiraceae bacterium]